jgi:hypothetical protein
MYLRSKRATTTVGFLAGERLDLVGNPERELVGPRIGAEDPLGPLPARPVTRGDPRDRGRASVRRRDDDRHRAGAHDDEILERILRGDCHRREREDHRGNEGNGGR